MSTAQKKGGKHGGQATSTRHTEQIHRDSEINQGTTDAQPGCELPPQPSKRKRGYSAPNRPQHYQHPPQKSPAHRHPVGRLHANRDQTGQPHVSTKQGPIRSHSSACKMPTEPSQSASTSYAQPWVSPHQLARSTVICTKMGKPDYSTPKAYRPIALLNYPREAYGYSPGLPVTPGCFTISTST